VSTAETSVRRGPDRRRILINLVEVFPANWSFGHGIAQYVADKG
jgi:hypothetical protein